MTACEGVTDNSGYNLNADSLMIAGTPTPLTFLPAAAQVSTPGRISKLLLLGVVSRGLLIIIK